MRAYPLTFFHFRMASAEVSRLSYQLTVCLPHILQRSPSLGCWVRLHLPQKKTSSLSGWYDMVVLPFDYAAIEHPSGTRQRKCLRHRSISPTSAPIHKRYLFKVKYQKFAPIPLPL